MKNIFTFLLLVFIGGQFLWGQPANLVWNTQSRNASESMPCGGGDIGMNVWVENDDVLFYLSRSGSFDENNTSVRPSSGTVMFDTMEGKAICSICLSLGFIYII